jgi:hypothetical protein
MKHPITLAIILCFLASPTLAQSSFFSGKKNSSSQINIGISHWVYHLEDAWKGWALWFDYANFEIGVGLDFGNYPTTTTEDWTSNHNAGEPYTHIIKERHMCGASASLYYGWFFNDFLAAGVTFDLLYGPRDLTTRTYNYGYGIGSTTTISEGNPEHTFSTGIYIKGNYQITDQFNFFLMWQACLDGNSGLSLGFLYNI